MYTELCREASRWKSRIIPETLVSEARCDNDESRCRSIQARGARCWAGACRMCDLAADRIRLAAAGQGWFIALQGSSSSIRRDVHPGIWAVCEWRVIRPEVRRRSTKCTSRRLHVQVNLADLHSGVADVLSLALIVSYMGCVKTRAAPTRIEIEAVSA